MATTGGFSKLADRSKGNAFGVSTAQQREKDRERERLERERLEREARDPMNELSEEQREEINEAVRLLSHWQAHKRD